MSVVVPVPVGGTATGWQLVDYATPQASAVADANGRAAITFDQLDPNQLWLIDHAVVNCPAGDRLPPQLRLYAGSETPSRLLDGSSTGDFDVADWPNGLQLSPSTSLLVVWSGAVPGATATIALQVRVLRRP
jgi:hypothetical protein